MLGALLSTGRMSALTLQYAPTAAAPVPVAAINSKPEQGNRFEDLTPEFGLQYLYTVRSVIRVNGELVESNLSNEVACVLAAPE